MFVNCRIFANIFLLDRNETFLSSCAARDSQSQAIKEEYGFQAEMFQLFAV